MASSDPEVKTCSKNCLKNYEALKKQYDDLLVKLSDIGFKAATYKRGLATLEDQIVKYREHEVHFSEKIALLKRIKKESNVVCENSSNETKKNSDAPLIEEWVSDNEDEVESPVVFNAVKNQACLALMPKNRVVDHVSKNISASVTLKRLDYIDAQGRFKSVMAWIDAQIQGRQECSKEKEESREECSKSRKTKKMKWEDCWELNTSELVLPRDELVLLSQQLVLLEENSSYCSRLQLPVLNQSVNTARITAVGEKVNAAESLLVVSTEVNAN
ncbi:hypothetical protein Tco_0195020 [Tanacetum coccineum]